MRHYRIWLSLILVLSALSACTDMESPSYCDLYPAGNSHAGEKCRLCHRHFGGKWYSNEGNANEAEKPCPVND